MPEAVYRMLTLVSTLVVTVPVGTNLGLVHLLWMLVSGQLLATRGAVIPGLSACGLSRRAVRRAWGRWGRAPGRARRCSHGGGQWWPPRGAGSRACMAATARWWPPCTRSGDRSCVIVRMCHWTT